MSGPAAAVRGLLGDIERVAAAADSTLRELDARGKAASERRSRALAKAAKEARESASRAERAEEALKILQQERTVTRTALEKVAMIPDARGGQRG